MHPNLPESALTFLVTAGVAIYVARKQERKSVHWLLLCLLAAMMAWTGGLSIFFAAGGGVTAQRGLALAFVGVFALPPCWLLLAARHTHVHLFDRSPGWLMAILVPPAMTSLAVVTNSGHRLFVKNLEPAALQAPAHTWAGPIFWLGIGFGILLMLAGVGLYLGTAYRMLNSGQRARGAALAAIVMAPVILSPLFGVLMHRDVTPTLIGMMIFGLFAMNWRHRVLETIPIARRDVIEHLPDAVVICDNAGLLLDLNPAAVALMGRPEVELRGQNLAPVLCALAIDSHRESVEATCRALLATGAPIHTDFPSGAGRLIEFHASGVRGGDGETSGFYALLRDRTEHRRHEEFMRQGDRMQIVASLTSGIALEVNNPLAFVRANLNHIQRIVAGLREEGVRNGDHKRAEYDELEQVAAESLDGVERVGQTVARMRRFSLIKDDAPASVDMNVVVRDAIRMAELCQGMELAVRSDLAVFLPPVQGSAEHLVQAVLNLVVNAHDAVSGQRDGRIRIETRRQPDEVEVHIIDNGPGVPVEHRQRLSDPDGHIAQTGDGRGFGLAIALGIVRDHGGSLDLETALEHGSEFVIRLPVGHLMMG